MTATTSPHAPAKRRKHFMRKLYKYRYFYLMFLPVLVLLTIFHYIPMAGVSIAFFDWGLFGAKDFVGLDNFKVLFNSNMFWRSFRNTLILSTTNLALSMLISISFALLLNEINRLRFKKLAQTIVYLPHFLSWVVVASIFMMILSPQNGIVNNIIASLGGKPIYFMVSKKWWVPIYLLISQWKEAGWGTIIYMAAITGIDQQMYEAALLDGATRLQKVWYITLPSIQNTILVVLILNLAKVLNVFESVWVLYNPMVYDVADVIETYVYRMGIEGSNYGMSTALGLFKSVTSLILVTSANKLSQKVRGEGIL